MLQNSLTKQPHRVIEVVFHRFIKLEKATDFLTNEQKENNIKMVLLEDQCIEKLNEVVRVEDLRPLDDEERGGEAPELAQALNSYSHFAVQNHRRSQNCSQSGPQEDPQIHLKS